MPGVSDHCFGVLLILQGHRTVEAGRDLWRSSTPMSLLQRDQTEPVAQDHVQLNFDYLQSKETL